jgi:hypothetical protein
LFFRPDKIALISTKHILREKQRYSFGLFDLVKAQKSFNRLRVKEPKSGEHEWCLPVFIHDKNVASKENTQIGQEQMD